MPSELATIELTLKARKFNKIPEWQGRAAQALLYSSLHRIHEMVSETIHDLHKWQPMMPKPFTMSTLLAATKVKDMIALDPNHAVYLRLTTLHPHMTGIVLQGVLPIWQREGISLHDQQFFIHHVQRLKTNYGDILSYVGDQDCLTLHFSSPTAFKQTNRGYLAEPRPNYIFKSLFNRWNAFANEKVPPQISQIIESQIQVVDTNIQKRTLSFARGRKGVVPGFYGTVNFVICETSDEARQFLNALAFFAEFSGVGIKTTIGMGQATAK